MATAEERLAASLAAAFEPLLGRVSRYERSRNDIEGFLGLSTPPVVHGFHFEHFEVSSTLWAISRWCRILVQEGQAGAEPHPRVDSDDFEVGPTFRDVEVGSGETEPCLAEGTLFVDAFGERAVISLGLVHKTFYEELRVDVLLSPAAAHGSRILGSFRETLRVHDLVRGRHVLFDRKGLGFLQPSGITWDDVVLPLGLVEEVRQNSSLLLHAWKRGDESVPRTRSMLLVGPPGTGKTLIGKALQDELSGITFAWVTPGGFDNAADPGFFFRWARKRTPAVLFFEDLDLVASVRDVPGTNPALGEILAQIDGFVPNDGLIVIATTNDPEAIDQALRRPGRFDRQLRTPLPEEEARRTMLARFLGDLELVDSDRVLRRLARLTAGLSGAHLRELVATMAIEKATAGKVERAPVTLRDLERALGVLRKTRVDVGFAGGEVDGA